MATMPGTVSKILWHFPGGPAWDPVTKCQLSTPKLPLFAFDALCGIHETKELRLGGYREVAKMFVPMLQKLNKTTRKLETFRDQWVTLESKPVCCLADIPVAHLSYHAIRYGKIAIGFHRDAVVECGFNPVLYSLQKSRVMRDFRDGIAVLELNDFEAITESIDWLDFEVSSVECDKGHEVDMITAQSYCTDIKGATEAVGRSVDQALNSFRNTLAFIKTFASDEFDTIYCEREWRCVCPFKFSFENVAMIVAPSDAGGVDYFTRFVDNVVPALNLPRAVPVVPWEDLIEH